MLTGNSILDRGSFKGTRLSKIPAPYLLYMLECNKLSGGVRDYVEAHKPRLEQEKKEIVKARVELEKKYLITS